MSKTEASVAPVIEVQELTVRYGRQTAIQDVSLRVDSGSIYVLLGRNGTGKTSLLRCLLGHRPAATGACRVFGLDPWSQRVQIAGRIGVMPETPDVPPEMTAAQASAFCARLYPSWDRQGLYARLARFEVPMNAPFRRLSRGQKAQLQLALALAPQVELLILDDPTIGLDAVARRSLYEEVIGELADRGCTVFLTTHDLAGVEGIAERIGILGRTRLLLDEPLESLRARFRTLRFGPPGVDGQQLERILAGCHVLSRTSRSLDLEVVVDDYDRTGGADRLPLSGTGGGVAPEVLPMSLEEIFVAVIGAQKEEGR